MNGRVSKAIRRATRELVAAGEIDAHEAKGHARAWRRRRYTGYGTQPKRPWSWVPRWTR